MRDYFSWTENIKGEREGSAYGVLALASGSEPAILQVKVPDKKPRISQATIDEHNATKSFLEVSFENFQARTYTDRAGHMALSCKATDVTLESPEAEIDY